MRNVNLRKIAILLVFLILLSLIGNASAAVITSTFDIDDEGWDVSGDATSTNPTHVLTGGIPGGFIQATDRAVGGTWYFDAPDKFLGNALGAYNQSLTFDLKQTGSGPQHGDDNVIMNGGGLELYISAGAGPLPLGTWVSYNVLMNESGGWFKGNALATQADMLTVLGDLDRLRIRGEFIVGSDVGRLDNVALTIVPLPPAFALLASGLLGILFKSRSQRVCRKNS